jgi:hypothetical protein
MHDFGYTVFAVIVGLSVIFEIITLVEGVF